MFLVNISECVSSELMVSNVSFCNVNFFMFDKFFV